MQFDATIFGGLPVVVEASRHGAQRDVGIMSSYFEVDAIYTTRYRKRDGKTIYKPIPDSWWQRLEREGQIGELAEAAAEHW